MKKIYLTCLLLINNLVLLAQVDSTIFKILESVVVQTQRQYAPDKRTRLVEIKHADLSTNSYHIQTTEAAAIGFLEKQLHDIKASVHLSLFPDSSVSAKPYGVINLSVANLRTEPRHSAELATQVIMGTAVDILDTRSGDYRIRTPEGYISWVPHYSVTAMDKAQFESWISKDKVIFIKEFGQSYSSIHSDSPRISDLIFGNILALKDSVGDFYQVDYPDGRKAYVKKDETVLFKDWLTTRQLTRDNIIQSAKTMMGLPYLWGGTSVRGVDCSGFTKTVFYMNGFIIPRDASQQVLAGNEVDILDSEGNFNDQKALHKLLPGDLIFFAAAKGQNINPRVTHVAIYIGDGEFIHAAGAVRINSFISSRSNYDDFQTRSVVSARRYVGSNDPLIQFIAQSKYY